MKKLFLATTLIALAIPAFGQEGSERWDGDRRMAITANLTPILVGAFTGGFGMGAGFEFAPGPSASARLNLYYIGFDSALMGEEGGDGLHLLRLNLDGRWYPQNVYARGWFLNGGLQYHAIIAPQVFWGVNGEDLSGTMNTWSVMAGVGYKFVARSTQRVAFVIEPKLDFVWAVHSDIPRMPGDFALRMILGTGGPRFSLMMGAAF